MNGKEGRRVSLRRIYQPVTFGKLYIIISCFKNSEHFMFRLLKVLKYRNVLTLPIVIFHKPIWPLFIYLPHTLSFNRRLFGQHFLKLRSWGFVCVMSVPLLSLPSGRKQVWCTAKLGCHCIRSCGFKLLAETRGWGLSPCQVMHEKEVKHI